MIPVSYPSIHQINGLLSYFLKYNQRSQGFQLEESKIEHTKFYKSCKLKGVTRALNQCYLSNSDPITFIKLSQQSNEQAPHHYPGIHPLQSSLSEAQQRPPMGGHP